MSITDLLNEVGEQKLIVLNYNNKKVGKSMKTTQNGQKSYTNNRRRDFELEKEDFVFVKVSSSKGIMNIGKKEKLSPFESFEILDRVDL